MTPLSETEAAIVARFEAAEPAPESWDGGLREVVARWLFERQDVMRRLASPEDADWDEWVERNREEWREVADELLTIPLAALRAKAAAADRVRECIDSMDPIEVALGGLMYVHGEIRRALDGADRTDRGRC